MTEEALKARREYKRKWQQANKDKVKEYQARYWLKKAAQMKEGDAEDADYK